MNDLAPAMTDLKGKIELLVKSHQELKLTNDGLNQEMEKLRSTIAEQQEKIEKLENTNRELLSVKEVEKDNIVKDTKVKINELVQEIDECITLLNK